MSAPMIEPSVTSKQKILVHKFGGTSVSTAKNLAVIAQVIRENEEKGIDNIVVVSALAGVTDALIDTLPAIEWGEETQIPILISALRKKHWALIAETFRDDPRRGQLEEDMEYLFTSLEKLLNGVCLLRELTMRTQDMIIAFGEKLSSTLVASALEKQGIKSQPVFTEELVITDNSFGGATVKEEATAKAINQHIRPVLAAKIVPVLTGFIGSTAEGETTTLGRGGSDYSATLIGSALKADEVWIWTDVDGMMTADPKLVSTAQLIPAISYIEAAELAYFGAKVLHPKCLRPAMNRNVPIRIKNTFNPSSASTVITGEIGNAKKDTVVKGITTIRGCCQITIEGCGMLGVVGTAARVFSAVAKHNVNILMISQGSSEHSICFVTTETDASKAIEGLHEEFRGDTGVDSIYAQEDVGIIALVGSGMRSTPGIAGRLFSVLGEADINVITIAQGSSEVNVSFVVKEADILKAVQALHRAFELDKVGE